ncbi:MAG: hypothetical protein GVY04_21820 [Cyanobacteria bacterium]|nr:hypothetical protein [Cyanobacteria bacterium GSL.Bin1]
MSIKILKTAESIAFFASLGVCSKNGFSLSLASTIFYDERQVKNNERQVKNNFLRALHRISFIDHLNHDGDGEAYKQRYKITHPLIHEFSKDMLNGDLNELLKDIINLEDYITLAQAKQRHAKYFVDLVNEQVISDINDNENLSIITKRQLKIRCLGKIVNLYFYNNKIKNKFEEAKNYLRNISTIANNIKIENNVDLFPEDLVPELLLKIYYARLYFSKAKAEDFKHENSRQWVRKAKKICEKAVKNLGNKLRKYDESQQHKQLLYIDIVLGQLGEYCLWLGRLESEGPNKRSNFENARKYLEISCKINDECKNLHGSSLTLKNLGITYKELMNLEEDEVEKGHLFDQAKEKLLESYFINKELNDNKVPDQSWALIELFDLYISQNKDLYEIINEIIKNESDENLNKTEKLIETICKNLKYPMKGKVIVFNNESQFSFIKSDKGKVKKILNYDYGFITSECLPGKKIYFDIKRNNFDSLDQDQVVEFKVNYLPNNPPDYKWRANIDLVGDPTANGQKTTLRV